MREAEVVHATISGGRPPKLNDAERIGITGVVWDPLRERWREDRVTRPNISDVLERFNYITGRVPILRRLIICLSFRVSLCCPLVLGILVSQFCIQARRKGSH
jgi:hypothetical protein